MNRNEQIQNYLKPGKQVLKENSDKCDKVVKLLLEIQESGDLAALLQISSYTITLAQKI